jgi:hypothetical protein
MKELKEYSSKWLKNNPNFSDFESFAESFVAFTYKQNDKQTIIDYPKMSISALIHSKNTYFYRINARYFAYYKRITITIF